MKIPIKIRAIAAIVVFAFVFPQTGISYALREYNPGQRKDGVTGVLGREILGTAAANDGLPTEAKGTGEKVSPYEAIERINTALDSSPTLKVVDFVPTIYYSEAEQQAAVPAEVLKENRALVKEYVAAVCYDMTNYERGKLVMISPELDGVITLEIVRHPNIVTHPNSEVTGKATGARGDGNPFNTVFDYRLLSGNALWLGVNEWIKLLSDKNSAKVFLSAYYEGDKKIEKKRREILTQLRRYKKEFGVAQSVTVLRIPGRAHTVGVHVDRTKGPVNRFAVEKEMIAVVGKREDSKVVIKAQKEYPQFSGEVDLLELFDSLPKLDSDYKSQSDSPSSWDQVARKIEGMMKYSFRGKYWFHSVDVPKSPRTFAASAIYLLNDYFAEKTENGHPTHVLSRGFNVVMVSDIPPAAGISSSSATDIVFAVACSIVNGIKIVSGEATQKDEINFMEWLSRLGYAEWGVGTRGSEADHASIVFGTKNGIAHIGPEGLRTILKLPEGCHYVLINTSERPKVADMVSRQRVESFNLGLLYLKALGHPKLKDIKNLADIVEKTGMADIEILQAMLGVPDNVTREDLYADVDRGALSEEEVKNIIGPRDGKSGYEQALKATDDRQRQIGISEWGLTANKWNPRRVALEQIADIRRSIRNKEILESETLAEEQKADLILGMIKAYQESMRVTDFEGRQAVWNRGVSDDNLDAAIRNIKMHPDNAKYALENLPNIASYGLNSRQIDELTRFLYAYAKENAGNMAIITLGMGGGGSFLLIVKDVTLPDGSKLVDTLKKAYNRFARRHRYSRKTRLWVNIAPSRGAEAFVPPAKKVPTAAAAAIGLEVVLLVDDEEQLLKLNITILNKMMGVKLENILTAGNADEAIREIDRRHAANEPLPDLVISDLKMPDKETGQTDNLAGMKVVNHIAENLNGSIPVIIVSGTMQDLPAEDMSKVAGVLNKPYEIKDFAEKITEVMAARAGEAPAAGIITLADIAAVTRALTNCLVVTDGQQTVDINRLSETAFVGRAKTNAILVNVLGFVQNKQKPRLFIFAPNAAVHNVNRMLNAAGLKRDPKKDVRKAAILDCTEPGEAAIALKIMLRDSNSPLAAIVRQDTPDDEVADLMEHGAAYVLKLSDDVTFMQAVTVLTDLLRENETTLYTMQPNIDIDPILKDKLNVVVLTRENILESLNAMIDGLGLVPTNEEDLKMGLRLLAETIKRCL